MSTDPQAMLDKALRLIDQHLTQIRTDSTTINDKGTSRGLSGADSQVIERYSKILITLTKKTNSDEDLDGLSDEALAAVMNGQDNVPDALGDTE